MTDGLDLLLAEVVRDLAVGAQQNRDDARLLKRLGDGRLTQKDRATLEDLLDGRLAERAYLADESELN